ncbi:MAG: penicillin-binding protein 2 [Candidatus Omnitrophica bacterium]|nr:penicillin-binding protein 2 [Candidatus Omnitrophota bacterium]
MIRQIIVTFFIIFIFLALVFGLLNLQVFHGTNYRQLSEKNCIRLFPQKGSRGKIIDRDGNIIVANRLSYDVLILPQDAKQRETSLVKLGQLLEVDYKDLKKAYREGLVSVSVPVTVVRNINYKKAIALEELKFELPGVMIQPNPVRHYIYGGLACHILGYLNEIDRWRLTKLEDYGYKTKDIVGFGGVEEKYDYYLRQEEGGLSVEVDHRGRQVRLLGFRPPLNGKDVELTIDLKVQQIVENKLGKRKGSVVLMDAFTGEIIAMASSPGFNPEVFIEKQNSAISDLFKDKDSPLINRAISSAYPPGSIFKAIVALAALEERKINSSTTYICQGKVLVGKKEFACWSTHGPQDLNLAIAHSCNTYFYKTGLLLGGDEIYDYAYKFGLGKSTGFDLSYEVSGLLPSPLWKRLNKFQKWFDGDTANFSIGQGDLLATPLQMTRMMAVFANDGFLVTPHIIRSIAGKDPASSVRRNYRLNIKSGNLNIVKQGLRSVVNFSSGTGNVLSGLGVEVSGKTGTAQSPPGLAHAWFVGYFPYNGSKVVMCVFLEHGGPGYYSCVVAKEIIGEIIKYTKEGRFNET